jgi:hypothetical protein
LPFSSSAFLWLLRKEWRELLVSRSWWILLLAMGPLAGLSFVSAVRSYAELSGPNGAGEALSPLIGIWAPTFSACELAAVFLLPFVAIRIVGLDRQNGALKLELQQGMPAAGLMAAKTLVALAGWLIAMLPPLSAIPLWKSYGGALHPPEIAALTAGHILNAGLTVALGAAAAAIADHPSTAAILTLSATVGTWILSFLAAIHGGIWERAAAYTPSAMVGDFQHGLLRLDSSVIALLLIGTGLGAAAIWIRLGTSARRRTAESLALCALAAAAVFASTFLRGSWDLSENRANSFSRADERALRQIREPLDIDVHLSPEDPRRPDLERRALSKLRRLLPNVRVRYHAGTATGIYEQSTAGYGEIQYNLGDRSAVSRSTTEEGVLEAIYTLAGIQPASAADDPVFRGRPLAAQPKGAAALFYGFWPAAILVAAFFVRRSLT